MTEKIEGCVFCASSELTFWRGRHVEALLDIAPIVTGHTLVYSTMHYPSAADVPAAVAEELDEVCGRFREMFLEQYGGFTMFEHGRTGHCIRRNPEERICNHLHVHLLPLQAEPRIELSQRTSWTTWSDVADLAGELDGYLVVESAATGRQFYPVTHPLPPHYLRTAVAEAVGDPSLADWEITAGTARTRAAIEDARPGLRGMAAAISLPRADSAAGRRSGT